MPLRALHACLPITLIFLLVGCGGSGGGSNNAPPPPPPPPPSPGFTLNVSPTQINLSQTTTQAIQIEAIPLNGFSSSVSVSLTGLPSGVTASPTNLTLSVGTPATLTLAASSNATAGNAQVSFSGVSGSEQASTTLALDVIQVTPPIAVPFTTTGGSIAKAFYDDARQLLFASNLGLNEVDVLSGSNLTVQARIPIAQPFGIDQMPDGNTLVVGTYTQGFYTIDENTLAVTHHLAPNLSQQLSTTVLLIPVSMANGKVLFMGKDIGAGGSDIYVNGAQSIIEWDSSTGAFSTRYYVPYDSLEIDDLKRSADHNWAVYAADKLYIYSSASDTFTSSASPVSSAPFGVRDIAANPNGTQFAVVSAYSVTFYDASFNALGTAGVDQTSGLVFQNNNAQYSADGSLLYWELSSAGSIVDVLNTSNFTEVGHIITDFGAAPQFAAGLLWVSNSKAAFLSADQGIGKLDCGSPLTDALSFVGAVGANPFVLPLNESSPVALSGGLPTGTSVTFAGLLAPVVSTQNNSYVVQVPASQVAGPVNMVFTQPGGETFTMPQNFVYGVDIAAPTSTLVPPIGNPVLGLFGYGMLNGPFAAPAVSVGGQTAQNVTVNNQANYILQELFLQIPGGTRGPADITVTSNNGTATLKAAVTYIPSAAIVPTDSSLLQLLYDTHRSLLYALQSNQVLVLNPSTQQWQSTLLPGGSKGFGYTSMALTPDGTQMMVLDVVAKTLTVFDPDNPSQSVSTPITLGAGATFGNVVATSTGKALIASLNGSTIEFDLATNTYATTNILSGLPSRLVASPDGRYVAGVNQNSGSGTLAIWSSTGGPAAQSLANDIVWTDVAVSPKGDLFAAIEGAVGYGGIAAAFFDSGLHFTNVTVYPDLAPPDQSFCMGAIFSNSEQTMLSPLADSIDFFSTATATLQGRLLMPEPLPVADLTSGVIALDPNQQTIYAISASGLTVVTLPSVVDDVAPFPWPYISRPGQLSALGGRTRLKPLHAVRQ